jgi:predicted RNA-binding Zn ribbon-like protein
MVTRLVGGHLALDFANTIEPSRDHIAAPGDLTAWARRAGVPGAADEPTLARARALRRTIYSVFRPIAEAAEPAPESLETFHAEAISAARLLPDFTFAWDGDVLAPIAVAAVDLLRFGPLDRIKVCDGCPWLFLDTSRNHSRRWCSMDDCGARTKMRRYRARRSLKNGPARRTFRGSPRAGRGSGS